MAQHPSNKITPENVADVVRYHAPTEAQAFAHDKLSMATEAFIKEILEHAPDCADRSAAIRAAREAKLWASAAVALEPSPEVA